jgi:hypothetical protein
MSQALVDHYHCPADLVRSEIAEPLSADVGYFRFGDRAVCY